MEADDAPLDKERRPSPESAPSSTGPASSPLAEKSENSRPSTSSSSNATTTPTALQPENIPPLRPPPTLLAVPAPAQHPESSFLDGPSLDLRHSDSQAEIVVRQHLQDIESSFTAPLSPIPASHSGADDTFLFDSPSKKPIPPPPDRPTVIHEADEESELLPPPRSPTPPTPRAHNADDSLVTQDGHEQSTATAAHDRTSLLEAFSSSPTAAATARTISRAVSHASAQVTQPEQQQYDDEPSRDQYSDQEQYSSHDQTGTESDHAQSREESFNAAADPQRGSRPSLDAVHTPGQALRVAKQRSKYLRSRHTSQRSSISSLATDPDSDVTVGLGTDYALQSGGATPSQGLSRNVTNALSRTISMGSMASGIDDMHDTSGPPFSQLETLAEIDRNMSPQRPSRRVAAAAAADDDDLLKTPRPKRNSAVLSAPTDTVIARHVRDVHVPESLAREYKTKGGLVTPRKHVDFTPASTLGTSTTTTTSRHGAKSLTLKEQSSTIERLSKENFDLKLKVMFLSDRLDKLSEEGIKEMISENVELKTGLAVLQRDNKVLRRRVKELEKQLKDEDLRPGTARSVLSDDEQSAAYDHEAVQERDEEILYLREQMDEYVVEIERLRNENMTKEAEKRRMADVVRSLGERAGERMGGDHVGRQEEADVWKDLLEQETARREQGDEDNRRLRDEVFRLKQELSSHSAPPGNLHHTTNIYNISKKREQQMSPTRSSATYSNEMDLHGTMSAGSTLVEDLRRESDQLRHENAELRREVGAQTSMLTSRNREKERLYQEIEDLKMAQRRGGPAPSTIDSLLERSASRAGAHERTQSRTSGNTRATATALDDADRDELENKITDLRDKNSQLKLQNQDLQRELDACMDDFETAVEAKKQAEELVADLQEDLDAAMNDLMALQAERDEALQEHGNLEAEFEALRKEAQEEIDALEGEADQRQGEIQRLQLELSDRTENFDALQEEMRKLSDALIRLEDEQEAKHRRIQQLEHELGDANKELEDLEQKLLESNDKAQRLSVQQESSQGEIAFLREEQEGDKIRIGDLEALLANAEQALREEKDRARELEHRLAAERKQREILATREKEEVQQFVNELNREASAAKDEVRRLRKNLTNREVEATEWKERLIELENNLREALGDLNGTRSSLLKSIAKLQRDLENTVRDLDATRASLMEKDRIIKQRDALLESHALESRKMADMLDKERQAHRNTKHQYETFQKTHQHVTRTVTSQDSRILDLEAAKSQDKKRISQLELNFKDALTERNNLLLLLWSRLSALCGSDWAHDNSLINGRALPSLEAVATMLPGFAKNLLAAVKTIETTVSSFQAKVKSVEKDLWREYQSLESHLDMRTKKLERLEAVVRNNLALGNGGADTSSRTARLEEAYRQLKVENHTLRAAAEARAARAGYPESSPGGSPSPSIPTGPNAKAKDGSGSSSSRASRIPKSGSRGALRTATMSSATSSSQQSRNLLELEVAEQDGGGQRPATSVSSSGAGGNVMDSKWMLRLRDLEYKLKAEREGRLLDRGEAMKRITASESENVALREGLEREKRRGRGDGQGGSEGRGR
ncbi:hypothetical protein B0T18DRAFT_488118 [Schizothecium vesticola]|uniref:Anucleate primary sterigmata protein B n=1 Tax=Schizothecium vesticola TaxID=314040 RepID=A0AA40F3F5_9PEZI|nr:hypothetical protein B0T18DRAFT_488118 [Schizothecium vesticola]